MEFSDHLTFDTIGLGISKVGGDNLLLNFRSASDRPDQLLAKERPHVPDFHARARGGAFGVDQVRIERFMDPEYLPKTWSNPVHPAYKLPRPLVSRDGLFAGQVSIERQREISEKQRVQRLWT